MKNVKEFFLINKQRTRLKDLENLKIFHIKKMILLRLNMVAFIKVLVSLFIKGAELNQ